MREKTFGLGEGIIATHPSNIDGDSADERPVGSSVVVFKGSSIFSKKHIFDPMQTIFNPPMPSNPWRQFKRRGNQGANVITRLLIRFSPTDANALDLDETLKSHPVEVNTTDVSKDIYNPTGRSSPIFLNIDKPFAWLSLLSFGLKLCQQPRLIALDSHDIVVTALNN